MKGFTLIELTIYSAIVCVVLIVASTFAWQIIQGNIKTQVLREVEQNAGFAMEKIASAVRNSSGIIQPDNPGETSSFLSLDMQDQAKTPTIFEVSDGKIFIKEGSGSPIELTTDLTETTNLNFTNLSYEDTPGTIRIEMTVEYVNPTGRSEYGASVNLENSVSLKY